MDRLFLDANVLFSAAYRPNAGLLRLWRLPDVVLCTGRYALEEARTNLTEDAQRHRLDRLSDNLKFFDSMTRDLPRGVNLPEKDIPILLAAIEARSTHLITGDLLLWQDAGRDSCPLSSRLSSPPPRLPVMV